MWLATKNGFFSVVTSGPDVQIRARFRGDLENLQRHIDRRIRFQILGTPKADYPYRAIVTRTGWRRILEALGEGVDYPNFKNKILATPDQADKHDVYARLWMEMAALAVSIAMGRKPQAVDFWMPFARTTDQHETYQQEEMEP